VTLERGLDIDCSLRRRAAASSNYPASQPIVVIRAHL
jgi:hypothetical protein